MSSALAHAAQVADSYDPDYATWAAAHGYRTDPKSAWCGSSSYSEGRAAHTDASNTTDRLRRFLSTDEYTTLLQESRTAVS